MKRQKYNIADNLPESLNRDNLREVAETIDKHMHELDMLSELCSIYPRIDELSSALIDALAVQFHVDFYDMALPLETRRALVKNSIRWHMKKGTKGAVQEIVRTVFSTGVVTEWYEYGGKPYHFRVDLLTELRLSPENIATLVQAVGTVKNVRSWLDYLGFSRKLKSTVYYGFMPCSHVKYSIWPVQAHDAENDGTIRFGAANTTYSTYDAYPPIVADNTAQQSKKYISGAIVIHRSATVTQEEG